MRCIEVEEKLCLWRGCHGRETGDTFAGVGRSHCLETLYRRRAAQRRSCVQRTWSGFSECRRSVGCDLCSVYAATGSTAPQRRVVIESGLSRFVPLNVCSDEKG